jgi:hypothetical protein
MGLYLILCWLFHFQIISPANGECVGPSYTGDSLTVYVFLADQCKISQFYTVELARLDENYSGKKVGFVGYFPSELATPEVIDSFGSTYHLDFPLMRDDNKSLTRRLGITITPEVAVWDHRTDRMIYRGRIDDSYVRVGKRKLHPQSHDLVDIIDAWLIHQTPEVMIEARAVGCYIGG